MSALRQDQRGWLILMVPCSGMLMVGTHTTIIDVALPQIQLGLGLADNSLVWVPNAYFVTFGGFLLLGGRLGDLVGRRRIFVIGTMVFTIACVICGLATATAQFLIGRVGQGIGGALVSAVSLIQAWEVFEEERKRATALGMYVFAGAAGGALGVLLGGVLMSLLDWRWIFLVYGPMGAGITGMSIVLLRRDAATPRSGPPDVAGAITITASLVIGVHGIIQGGNEGWAATQTLTALVGAGALLVLFITIEARARLPLIPLDLFRRRNVIVVIVATVLLAGAILGWRFIAGLYLQLIRQLTPLYVGLAFLPAHLTIAVISCIVSPALVVRFGFKQPLIAGLLISAAGLACLSRSSVNEVAVLDVLPGMLLMGLGTGVAYNPLLLALFGNVTRANAGVASGLFNCSYMMGGVLGLSVIATIATARTDQLLAAGADLRFALNSGYQMGFRIAAAFAVLAAIFVGVLLTKERNPVATEASE